MLRLTILIFCLAAFCIFESHGEAPPLVSQDCLDCVCQLATGCDLLKGCDGEVCGPFGITMPFWEDTEGIVDPDGSKRKDPELKAKYEECASDYFCSTKAVQKYMDLYKRDCNKDGIIDCEDFAAIHMQGPNGCLEKPFPEEKRKFIETCLGKDY